MKSLNTFLTFASIGDYIALKRKLFSKGNSIIYLLLSMMVSLQKPFAYNHIETHWCSDTQIEFPLCLLILISCISNSIRKLIVNMQLLIYARLAPIILVTVNTLMCLMTNVYQCMHIHIYISEFYKTNTQ